MLGRSSQCIPVLGLVVVYSAWPAISHCRAEDLPGQGPVQPAVGDPASAGGLD